MNFPISDFKSQVTIPTKNEDYGDFLPFALKDKKGVLLVRDFPTFIQAIGKVHYLAANVSVRTEGAPGVLRKGNAHTYRVYYRGQTELYKKRDQLLMIPAAYRVKTVNALKLADMDVEAKVRKLKNGVALKSYGLSNAAVEGVMQQYCEPSRWLDVVDNIWVALWFACYRAWTSQDIGETLSAGKFTHSEMRYIHYERRNPRSERCSARYAYFLLIGVDECGLGLNKKVPGMWASDEFEVMNLRQALPSQYIRPHAQHGLLIRKKKADGNSKFVTDLRDCVLGVIKIPLDIALNWLGDSPVFLSSSMFPPPSFDTGYRDLLFRDERDSRIFKNIVLS